MLPTFSPARILATSCSFVIACCLPDHLSNFLAIQWPRKVPAVITSSFMINSMLFLLQTLANLNISVRAARTAVRVHKARTLTNVNISPFKMPQIIRTGRLGHSLILSYFPGNRSPLPYSLKRKRHSRYGPLPGNRKYPAGPHGSCSLPAW